MEPTVAGLSLIDLAVVGGLAVVVPASVGGRWGWWVAVAAASVGSFWSETGTATAVLLALPWLALGTVVIVHALRAAGPLLFWTREDSVRVMACGYGAVAASWLVLSRAAVTPLGIHEPIVQLTAVHFTY